jgi:hypothetical protein
MFAQSASPNCRLTPVPAGAGNLIARSENQKSKTLGLGWLLSFLL